MGCQRKKFSREYRVMCHKIKISTNLFPMKDAILVWFTTAIKRLFKVVQAQKGFKSKKVQGLQLQEIWLPTWEVLPDLSYLFL